MQVEETSAVEREAEYRKKTSNFGYEGDGSTGWDVMGGRWKGRKVDRNVRKEESELGESKGSELQRKQAPFKGTPGSGGTENCSTESLLDQQRY